MSAQTHQSPHFQPLGLPFPYSILSSKIVNETHDLQILRLLTFTFVVTNSFTELFS